MGTRPLYAAREHFNAGPAIDAMSIVQFVKAAQRSGIAGAAEIRTFGGIVGGRFRPSPEVERLIDAAEAEVRGAEKVTPNPLQLHDDITDERRRVAERVSRMLAWEKGV